MRFIRLVRTLALPLLLLLLLPSGAKAQITSTHNVTVAWTYTQGTDLATGFNVYRATVAGGPYAKLTASPLALNVLSFQDFTGSGGTKYFYIATAVDISGIESVNSNEVSAVFIASSPNAPTNVTATAH